MNDFPGLKAITFATFGLSTILCISCNPPEKGSRNQEKNAEPAAISRQPAQETSQKSGNNSLQQQVETFFRKFSTALTKNDAGEASAMIAEGNRERFRKGFRFWRDAHFFDPLVVKVSGDKSLIDVEVSFKTTQGREDRETKKLQLTEGQWLLLDS